MRNLVLLALPVAAIFLMTQFFLSRQPSGIRPAGPSSELASFDPLVLLFMSVLALTVLLYELRIHGERVARLLMAGIMVAGVLSGLILLQFWVGTLGSTPAAFYLIAAPVSYLGLFFSVRYYLGKLSEKQAGTLLVLSTGLLGCMLGTFFSITFTVFLLLSLCLLDLLFVETDLLGKTVGLQRLDDLLSVTTLPVSEFGVGLGDLLAYSILVTSAFLNGGLYVLAATIALIVLGVLITL
ncbi:MAG TPA: hypothetical protein VE177_00370, partial [Candidatus Binatus sp.]|nr:hypothetical protein [Candidatus Binatus sp.]